VWRAVYGVLGNLVGVLEPLADNGGPTKTHALSIFSPAIDAGNNGFRDVSRGNLLDNNQDQRGEACANWSRRHSHSRHRGSGIPSLGLS